MLLLLVAAFGTDEVTDIMSDFLVKTFVVQLEVMPACILNFLIT